jgi:ribokinase
MKSSIARSIPRAPAPPPGKVAARGNVRAVLAPRVAVFGSIQIDILVSGTRLPVPGEQLQGENLVMKPGGRGFQLARQCARLGAETHLISQIGGDVIGRELLATLQADGVKTDSVIVQPDAMTATRNVFLAQGTSMSMACPGASAQFDVDELEVVVQQAGKLDAVLMCLDLPVAVAAAVAKCAADAGAQIVLNASPAPRDSISVIQKLMPFATTIVLTSAEASHILGRPLAPNELASAARTLGGMGPRNVIITAGTDGACAWDGTSAHEQRPFGIAPIDSDGAADAFLGTFTVLASQGLEIPDSNLCACAASAIYSLRNDTVEQLPTMQQLEQFLEAQ